MPELTPKETKLRAGIEAVLGCYKVTPDLEGMIHLMPRASGEFGLEDAIRLIERLGFRTETKKLDGFEVAASKIPALIRDASGDVWPVVPSGAYAGASASNGFKATPGTVYEIVYVYPDQSAKWHNLGHMMDVSKLDWFWMPIRKFSGYYWQVLLCAVFINLFVLAFPLFSMNVYDRLTVNFSAPTLYALTSGIMLVLVFDFLFKIVRGSLLEHIATNVGSEYETRLMERLLEIKAQVLPMTIGERMNLFREIQSLRDFYASRLAPALVDLPFFFLFLLIIYIIAPVLTLVPVVLSLFLLVANLALQMSINRSTKRYFLSMQSKSSALIQMLAGTETIRGMNAIGPMLFEWNMHSMQSSDEARRTHFYGALVANISTFATLCVSVFTLFFGVYLISESSLTVGGLVACSMLAGRSIGPFVNLASVITQYKRSRDILISIDRIFSLPYEKSVATTSDAAADIRGEIRLEDVSYKYPDQQFPALTGINLTIKPGERVGFIGRSGAGKSTLAKLITTTMDPTSGTILLDGYALASRSPFDVRRKLGYVPQDGYVFSGNIEKNITIGCENVTKDKLEQAVRISGLDAIMKGVGRGLDMDVGENGSHLSGGQRQAIALARVIMKDPKIVVFDEPTNGMDSVLETTIRQELDGYLKGRTFILITHRTSLLPLVDRLVLLDKGKVIADGPRDEILKKMSGG